MRRRLGLSLGALGAGVVLLVSGAFASPHGQSARGGTLRLMWGGEPDSVDPALATGNVGSGVLLNATCAKLFTTVRDQDTGKLRVVPEVVRSDSVSNGGRTYTFELKRTFRFHTGARVTAQSFADAFSRNANPSMNSPARSRGFMQEITGVQVLGRYRLRIRLTRHTGDFRARLTMPYFCPILPGTPIDPKGIDDPPGSGPYYLDPDERVLNRRIVLKRNRYYGGGRIANPDRIVWMIETDWTERLRATEQGENDFMLLGFGPPDAVVRDLVETYGVNRPGGQVLRYRRTLGKFLFKFNPERPAFKGAGQAPLRKAINYALDRPALARAHGYLDGTPSDRLLPAALSESPRLYPLGGPDLETARRWLARAGDRPQTLTVYTPNFPGFVPSAQTFASNLRQLGIVVDVESFDLPTFVKKLDAPGEPWDVALAPGSGAAYPDPAGALVPLLRGTRYEARINAANRVTGAARAKAWAELEADLMLNDPPVAAYADFTPLALVSKRFGCWSELDLAAVCKK